MAVVYLHKTKDTNVVFYIGIGKTEKRAYSKSARNKHWLYIVQKHDYLVEVLYAGISWEEACKLEKRLIASYGRRDLKSGTLTNLTDGGDGIFNPSPEVRERISNTSKGRRKTPEQRKRLSEKTKGANSYMYGKKGQLHPKFGKRYNFSEEHKRKLSEARLGRKYTEEHKAAMRVPKGPQELKTCPHCNKVGGNAMTRWHFNNCKQKKVI